MKTYLLDILNKYNRFSENLDVKTILCNKSWLVFNDTGNKELYIFQENGNLIASVNGNVHNGNWQYISANKSIILSFKEQSYMLHPSFFDKTIFALQQDGTNKYAFMIDEKQSQSFQPKSLTELNSYFENIERKRIEKEQQRIRILLAQQRAEQKRIEEEQRRQEQYRIEQEKKQKEQAKILEEEQRCERERIAKIKKENDILRQYKIFIIAKILSYIIITIITIRLTVLAYNTSTDGTWIVIPPIVFCILYYCVHRIAISWLRKKILQYHPHAEKRKEEKKKKKEEERKREEKKKKEKEWDEYKRQRAQKDFDRIEQHRIEREKKEKEERILREQENIKKEKEKKEQELREQELREREERKKWLKEEAFNIQCKLNSNKNAKELAKQISLDIKYLNTQYDKDLIFKVNWICPNHTYKEVSLIINNGNDTSLYEQLAILGSQVIELKEVKSVIRVTLRLVWLDIPVYKIILIDKNENT